MVHQHIYCIIPIHNLSFLNFKTERNSRNNTTKYNQHNQHNQHNQRNIWISISILHTLHPNPWVHNPMARWGLKGGRMSPITVVIIGDDRLGLDASAHFRGAKSFRQCGVGNRGPSPQQLVRGRFPLFHLFASC